jgi:hypothetical protein
MAELVSYLSIEPHMRTFDVFTETLSPAHAGLFLRRAISCASFAALPRTHMIHLSWSASVRSATQAPRISSSSHALDAGDRLRGGRQARNPPEILNGADNSY